MRCCSLYLCTNRRDLPAADFNNLVILIIEMVKGHKIYFKWKIAVNSGT